MWRRLARQAWNTPPGRRLASVSFQLNNGPRRAAATLRSTELQSAEKSFNDGGRSAAAIFIRGTPFPALCIDVLPETVSMSFQDPTSHICEHTHLEKPGVFGLAARCPLQLRQVSGTEDLGISK